MKAGGSRHPASVETVQRGEHYMRMDGKPIFKWAIRLIDRSVREVLDQAKLKIEDVDLFVLHQANIRILDAAADELGIDRRKMFTNLDKYGNTSAGSIPLALDEAVQQGRVERGSNIILCGFGAGLAWGTALWRW
jgi:3-oxoacyl-[acyl-carrier-protein] synthase-3